MKKGNLADKVTPLCEKLCQQMAYELIEVALDKEPAGSYLRIYLDKPGGITLDDCEGYHRAIQPTLEAYEYDFLEVSSPGIDRPLKKPKDFERHVGDEVEVRLYKPALGRKVFTGVLLGLEGNEVVIESQGEPMRFEQKAIALVKPVVDLSGIENIDL